MSFKARLVLLLAASCGLTPAALAADYEPPIIVDEAPEYTPVEVGSGWYLRGDVAYNFETEYKNTDFGASLDRDDLPLFSLDEDFDHSEKDTPVLASIGFGYHYNDWLRGDLNFGFVGRERFAASGPQSGDCMGTETTFITEFDADGVPLGPTDETSVAALRDCSASASVTNERWFGMANGYVDLGTYSGLTPYVGAGAGLLYTKSVAKGSARCPAESVTDTVTNPDDSSTETTVQFLCEGQDEVTDADTLYRLDDSERDYDFMYALSAGFGYKLAANTTLDVGYQFMSAPEATYYTIDDDGLKTNEGINFHQVKVGLRYDLW